MFIDTRIGGVTRRFLSRPKDWNVRIPEEVRKCVVFLCTRHPAGGFHMRGTGFVVGMPLGDTDQFAAYVVTAKHVAAVLGQTDFGIRVNLKAGNAETLWAGAEQSWWFHPLEPDNVDAAVLPLSLNLIEAGADFKFLPPEMFVTDAVIQEAKIGLGDEVFLSGLFVPLKGSRNEPIIRMGSIAAIPRDRVPRVRIGDKEGEAEVYLVEARSVGGISGSPVFVIESVRWGPMTIDGKEGQYHMEGGGPFRLLGLMHGHWTIAPDEHDRYDFITSNKPGESIAVGIAVVVPAKHILDIINRPELVEQRAKLEADWRSKRTTTPTGQGEP